MQNTPNQPQKAQQQQRPRSPRFPFVPLKKALEFARSLHTEFGVESVGPPKALKAMGYDVSSGKAHRVLAALKAYGLITREDGEGARIQVSPIGAKLVADPENAHLKTLRLAALEPPIFRRFWHNRPGITEPELANLLEQRSFTEQGARRAARVYTANVKFAQLEDPAFRNSNEAPPLPRGNGQGQGRGQAQHQNQRDGGQAEVVRAADAGVPQRLRVPLGGDFATIPIGVSKENFQLLMQTLRLWKSQIIAK